MFLLSKMNRLPYFIAGRLRPLNYTLGRRTFEDVKFNERRPSNWEKKLLVWFSKGKYKSAAEIPEFVPNASLSNVRTIFRIYMNVFAMLLALVGAYGAVQVGKLWRSQGHSMLSMALEEEARDKAQYGKK